MEKYKSRIFVIFGKPFKTKSILIIVFIILSIPSILWIYFQEKHDEKEFKNYSEIINDVEFELIAVEGGCFRMGCIPEHCSDCEMDERYTHLVRVDDFYIGKYEVTRAQWNAIMEYPNHLDDFLFLNDGFNYPIESVSYFWVQKYIARLNFLTGKQFRLPTEAEWEYAAKGGNKSDGYNYSGSNIIDSVAWYCDNSNKKPHPVGQKKPNELGIYDMSGNICEWCSDWYAEYNIFDYSNPLGPNIKGDKVLRGSGFVHADKYCRITNRSFNDPNFNCFFNGFRLVLNK